MAQTHEPKAPYSSMGDNWAPPCAPKKLLAQQAKNYPTMLCRQHINGSIYS